jgi:hypothetical protein
VTLYKSITEKKKGDDILELWKIPGSWPVALENSEDALHDFKKKVVGVITIYH